MWVTMEGDGEDVDHHGGRRGGCGVSWRAMGRMRAIMEGDGEDAGPSWRMMGRMWAIMEGDAVDAGHHGR